MPTATATPSPDRADLDLLGIQLVTVGVQLQVIGKVDELAQRAQAGEEVGSAEVFGLVVALGLVDKELTVRAESAGGRRAETTAALRASTASLGAVMGRWRRGEIDASAVASELAPVRDGSEEMLTALLVEMRRLGVSQADIDDLQRQIEATLR